MLPGPVLPGDGHYTLLFVGLGDEGMVDIASPLLDRDLFAALCDFPVPVTSGLLGNGPMTLHWL